MAIETISPSDVAEGLRKGTHILIDVREPLEYAAERIRGALLYPLSSFDPAFLPAPVGKTLVFSCGLARRSATALERCQAAGLPFSLHMAGGLQGWRMAGLPTLIVDHATGQFVEHSH